MLYFCSNFQQNALLEDYLHNIVHTFQTKIMNICYKNNLEAKYKIKNVSVLDGFLYFFGFRKNPYNNFIKNIQHRDDADALRSDWNSVGKDFEVIIKRESENLELNACK